MTKQDRAFIATVTNYYHTQGRHFLPWRKTKIPYRILVSEIMLQQTQVERVIGKYQSFIARWPTVEALARASLSEVLDEWQGLGYNRRAKYLLECAQEIMTLYNGRFPKSFDALRSLPGVGSYTAGAIMAFAYNISVPVIETNIRTVYIHHYHADAAIVSDAELLRHITRTLPPDGAREWYAALMDYGVYLKRTLPPVHRKSATYKKQARFKGSTRQLRGAIVRTLTTTKGAMTKQALCTRLEQPPERVTEAIETLVRDGLVRMDGKKITLP